MVKTTLLRIKPFALITFTLSILTGCPGVGDQLRPDEPTIASVQGENICFAVPGAEDYEPANIAINPRGTQSADQNIVFNPPLKVVNDRLCFSPSFQRFPEKGEFIISYVLHSKHHAERPRRMVAGMKIADGCISNIPLTETEILRPYESTSDTPVQAEHPSHSNKCENPIPPAFLNSAQE